VFGRPLAPTSYRERLRYNARLAGLSGHRVYPHRLRATFATRLNREGVTITVIQELMGHSDVKTTARYVCGLRSKGRPVE
jgi:integrase/recombinase XerD